MTTEEKLKKAREDLRTAGPIHARDLRKYIHRLEVQRCRETGTIMRKSTASGARRY